MGREQIKLEGTAFQVLGSLFQITGARVGDFCLELVAGISGCVLTASAGKSPTLTAICKVEGLQLVRVGGADEMVHAPWLYLVERRWRTRREQVQRRGGEDRPRGRGSLHRRAGLF